MSSVTAPTPADGAGASSPAAAPEQKVMRLKLVPGETLRNHSASDATNKYVVFRCTYSLPLFALVMRRFVQATVDRHDEAWVVCGGVGWLSENVLPCPGQGRRPAPRTGQHRIQRACEDCEGLGSAAVCAAADGGGGGGADRGVCE